MTISESSCSQIRLIIKWYLFNLFSLYNFLLNHHVIFLMKVESFKTVRITRLHHRSTQVTAFMEIIKHHRRGAVSVFYWPRIWSCCVIGRIGSCCMICRVWSCCMIGRIWSCCMIGRVWSCCMIGRISACWMIGRISACCMTLRIWSCWMTRRIWSC